MDSAEIAKLFLTFASGGAAGAFLTNYFTSKRERAARRHAFIRRQLQEFYSPLLGLRHEIKARSELRVKVQAAAQTTWDEMCADARERGGKAEEARLNTRFPEFSKIIDWDNENYYATLLPAYKQMIEIFREHIWLAEKETLQFFPALIEFVEIWERHQAKSIPGEVIKAINHREGNLHGFYDHLERMHETLREMLQ